MLLAQIQAGNSSYKLKIDIRQILYLLYKHNKITKTLQQFNQVATKLEVINKDNKLVKITESNTFHFDLPKDVDNTMKHKTDCFSKHNEVLAEHIINEISQSLSKYKHRNNIYGTQNSKTNEILNVVLKLLQNLDLRSSSKHVAL